MSCVIALPDEAQSLWQGCGGAGSVAALQRQTTWDVCGGRVQIELVDGRTHAAATAQQQCIWPVGALRLADLGYLSREVLQSLPHAGVTVMSRVKGGTVITTPTGGRLDLLGVMRQHPQHVCALEVQLYGVACRLIALPCSADAVARRRAVLQNTARKAQRAVSQAQWDWAGWTILFTTDATLTVSEILVLYRMRWQIEVLFHRWKEVWQVDTVLSSLKLLHMGRDESRPCAIAGQRIGDAMEGEMIVGRRRGIEFPGSKKTPTMGYQQAWRTDMSTIEKYCRICV